MEHFPYISLDGGPVEVGTVRRIYDYLALPFTKQSQERLRAFLADLANKSDRYGEVEYSMEPFGLTPAEFHERFRAYRERFLLGR